MKFQKISQASDSDDETMDLSNPVWSLSHYVDDEETLISEMFKALKFKRIKAMLPPVLRNAPIDDIKKLFVQEIAGMSRTRILASINGEEVNTSSSDSDLSDSEFDVSCSNSEEDSKFKAIDTEVKSASNYGMPNSETDDLRITENEQLDSIAGGSAQSNLTTLDIIELEMRAKLIKTMLEKQPSEETDEALENLLNVNIKTEPMSPELLAGIIKKEKITPINSPSRSRRSSSSDDSRSRSTSRRKRRSSSSSSSSSPTKKRRTRSSSDSRSSSLSRKTIQSSSSSSSDSTKKNSAGEGKNKRKLTRKEFEERMKKAKMNRSYRKREDSDEDSFDEEDGIKRKKYKKWKAKMQRKLDEKAAAWEKKYFEGLKKEVTKTTDKETNDNASAEDMEEGEVQEKEEGELESNEECEMAVEEPEVLEKEEGELESNEEGEVDEPIVAEDTESVTPIEPIEEISEIVADDSSMSDDANMTLPNKSDRLSISFSLTKKNANVVKGSGDSDEERANIAEDENLPKNDTHNENIEIIGEETEIDQDITESGKVDETHQTSNSPSSPKSTLQQETETIVTYGSTQQETEAISKYGSAQQEVKVGGASAENSCDSNIDIIGFIETKGTNKDSDSFDEDLISGSSWSSRWLQSDKVQTVVSDSKIMSKVRKKIQAKGKREKPIVYAAPPQPVAQPSEVNRPAKSGNVIGSIEEYEKVIGVAVPKKPTVTRKIPIGLGSSDSDDSEEDALWSQIMKK